MAYVMVVDDDDDFASAAATVLRSAGHTVEVRLDTRSAAQAMKENRPDLVVLDVMFPEDSSAGFELARKIRRCDGDIKDVLILLLTAVNAGAPLGFSPKDIDENEMPVSDFLEKPVPLDVLRNRVSALLHQVE